MRALVIAIFFPACVLGGTTRVLNDTTDRQGEPTTVWLSREIALGQVGRAIEPITVTSKPAQTALVIEPALPPGLSFEAETGIIAGTPLAEHPTTVHRIGGRVLTLTVANIETNAKNQILVVGSAMSPVVVTVTQATPRSFELNPSLPAGLSFETSSGTISGTPSAAFTQTDFAVRALCDAGILATTISLRAVQPVTLNAESITMTVGSPDTFRFSATFGEPPFIFELLSGPGSIDSSTGVFTAGATPGTATVRVTDSLSNIALATVSQGRVITNGPVLALASSGDDVYVGGEFSRAFPHALPHVGAFDDSTGKLDQTFDVGLGFDNAPAQIESFQDALIIRGSFSTYRGQPAKGLAKINKRTGVLDTTFAVGEGFDGATSGLVIEGSQLWVSGSFSHYDGIEVGPIVKLSAYDASIIPEFVAPNFAGSGAQVTGLAKAGDDIFATGQFDSVGGEEHKCVVAINAVTGAVRSEFSPQIVGILPSQYPVRCFTPTTDGQSVYLVGGVSSINGTQAGSILKVDRQLGEPDAGFMSNTLVTSAEGYVVRFVPNEGLFVLGIFSGYNGESVRPPIKIDRVSGARDVTFNLPTELEGVNANDVLFTSDAYYIVGSRLQLVAPIGFGAYAAKVNRGTGTVAWAIDNQFTPGAALVSAYQEDGRLFLIGSFRHHGGVAARSLAKFSLSDGRLDTTFTNNATLQGTKVIVRSLALRDDELWVGGQFDAYQTFQTQSFLKIDRHTANKDHAFHVNAYLNGTSIVRTLKYSNGAIYVSVGPSPSDFSSSTLAKWDATTGVPDTTFSTNVSCNGALDAITAWGDTMFIGGDFGICNGTAASRIARISSIDGSASAIFSQGFNGRVTSLAASGTELYVGGTFTDYRGTNVNRIASLQHNGTLQSAAGSGVDDTVNTLEYDTFFCAGGAFKNYNSLQRKHLFCGVQSTLAPTDPVTALNGNPRGMLLGGTRMNLDGRVGYGVALVDVTTGKSL